jgi:hypothetical protein
MPDVPSWRKWCVTHIERSWSDIKKVMALAQSENPEEAAATERDKARDSMRGSRAKTRAAAQAEPVASATGKSKVQSAEARGATVAEREAQTFEPRPLQEPVISHRPDIAAELAEVRKEVERLRRYKDENPPQQTILAEPLVETMKPTPDQVDPGTIPRMMKLLEMIFRQRANVGDVIGWLRAWHRLAPGYQPEALIDKDAFQRIQHLTQRNNELFNANQALLSQITELKRENTRLRAQLRKRGADTTTKAA